MDSRAFTLSIKNDFAIFSWAVALGSKGGMRTVIAFVRTVKVLMRAVIAAMRAVAVPMWAIIAAWALKSVFGPAYGKKLENS